MARKKEAAKVPKESTTAAGRTVRANDPEHKGWAIVLFEPAPPNRFIYGPVLKGDPKSLLYAKLAAEKNVGQWAAAVQQI